MQRRYKRLKVGIRSCVIPLRRQHGQENHIRTPRTTPLGLQTVYELVIGFVRQVEPPVPRISASVSGWLTFTEHTLGLAFSDSPAGP